MPEWKLAGERKKQYDDLFRSAQDLELNIGSTQYRISRMIKLREDIDVSIKKWWDEIIIEMNLNKDTDYMISTDGIVKEVPKKKVPVAPVKEPVVPETNAEELKSSVGKEASDLK